MQAKHDKQLPAAKFAVGDLRQLRRAATLASGGTAPAGTHFRVVHVESVPRVSGPGFTWRYTLWNLSWKNLKKRPPANMVLVLNQAELKDHSRASALPALEGVAVAPAEGAYFGQRAKKEAVK